MKSERSLARELRLAELMRMAQDGDSVSYGELLKEVSTILRPFLVSRVRESSDADDLVQEVLIGIHSARHTFDSKRSFDTWMFSIARYKLIDFYRKHSRRKEVQFDYQEWEQTAKEQSSPALISEESFDNAIDELPPEQNATVRMLKFESKSVRDVAQKLKMNEGAVRTMASRAYAKLRERFKDRR